MSDPAKKSRGALAGRWHLVAAECREDELPQHRVDLVFHDEPAGLRGAILSHADGREVPLHTVAFDGAELRLKMVGPPGQPAADPPFLVLAPVGDRFEGNWDKPGVEHIRLKLVRAQG